MLDIYNIRDLSVSVIVAYVLDRANWDLQIGAARASLVARANALQRKSQEARIWLGLDTLALQQKLQTALIELKNKNPELS